MSRNIDNELKTPKNWDVTHRTTYDTFPTATMVSHIITQLESVMYENTARRLTQLVDQ